MGGAEGGGRWFSAEVDGWPEARLAPLLTRALSELEFHQRHFHEGRLGLALRDRSVILIDDGAATGATLLAAVASLRALRVEEIVVAVPVASRSAIEKLEDQADRLAVVFRPRRFRAIGDYFADFSQISEGEVLHHLGEANRSRAA